MNRPNEGDEMKRRRRGRSEGTIFQRKDGRWAALVSGGWRDGRRVRKNLYGATRTEVVEKLKTKLHDQQQGLPLVGERETMAIFLDRWLEVAVKNKVRPLTLQSYRGYVGTHLKPGLGNRPSPDYRRRKCKRS